MDKATALKTDRFHYGDCRKIVGPRGGVKVKVEEWRRNGANKEWKRDADRWQVPIKYGMRGYSYIDQYNAYQFHAESDCPLNVEEEENAR